MSMANQELSMSKGMIIQGATTYEFETQMQPPILNQGVIQSWPTDQ